MSKRLVHSMDTALTSSNAGVLQVAIDHQTIIGEGLASNRLTALPGALNNFAELTPGVPLDLSRFDELRFWILSNRSGDGSKTRPFYLECSYTDAGDAPGEEHRWFVTISQTGAWEHRRIGIENDRRSAITSFRFGCIADFPFICYIDELLAVREEMLLDLEQSLLNWLDGQASLPGLTNVALAQSANPGDTQVVLPLTMGFHTDNRVLIRGGSSGDEVHTVAGVNHDSIAGTTTLQFGAADPVVGALAAGTATASVVVPVIAEAPPLVTSAPTPAVILTQLDAREDLERTGYVTQRDSFRPQGALIVCSVRPGARAYLVDYQVNAVAPERGQQLAIQSQLLQRLSTDVSLRVNGVPSPVWILSPPGLIERQLGVMAPLYLRIGTRMETALRRQQTWVRRADIEAGRIDAPLDQEGIVLEL